MKNTTAELDEKKTELDKTFAGLELAVKGAEPSRPLSFDVPIRSQVGLHDGVADAREKGTAEERLRLETEFAERKLAWQSEHNEQLEEIERELTAVLFPSFDLM